jgi:hypothetical protein
VAVIGSFELILNDDGSALVVLRQNVQPKLADRNLRRPDRQRHAQLVGKNVDVLREPGRKVTGLRGPHIARVGDTPDPAQALTIHFHRSSLVDSTGGA